MNRKISVLVIALLILSLTLIPFALAKPWDYPKNNEKFQSFSATFLFDYTYAQNLELEYKPSADDPNIIVASWEENFLDYHITIDGWTYNLGTDFLHEGCVKRTAIGAPFLWLDPFTGAPFGSELTQSRMEYIFNFTAVSGGIDGTLEMLSLWNVHGENFATSIHSIRGTGDLRNVQILATSGFAGHEGIVIGWPDIPPSIPP